MIPKIIKDAIYSGNNIVSINEIRYLPRWMVLFIDTLLLLSSILGGYYLLSKVNSTQADQITLGNTIFPILLVNLVCMYVFKTFAGIIRHSTFVDLLKILLANLTTVVLLLGVNLATRAFLGKSFFYTPFLVIYFVLSVMTLFIFRLLVKQVFHFAREFKRSIHKKRVLVLGIDEHSIAIARAIQDSPKLPYQLIGFLTEQTGSSRAKLLGKKIFSAHFLDAQVIEQIEVEGVVVIREQMTREEMNRWVALLLDKGLRIYKAPSVQKLRENDFAFSIKTLQIDDLLNRKPIKIENEKVKSKHFGKAVLVTGGAGSIGSEIVKQVSQFQPSLVVVLDQAETPLYDCELELRAKFPHVNFEFVLVNITQENRVRALFEEYRFSMVYHAAAYKHVPVVEHNPLEAISVNVLGTKYLADLSMEYGVNRFVMISTDKAVNPTNVMGATKRTAELYVQSLQRLEGNRTKFITTRFGNVLGSNGSVIPLFKKQIEAGGPITITHPDIVRYFMTIPEACELVLEAGTMGQGGEIFVFDMGEPVKIVDLAKKIIKLSGFEPDIDIPIIFTGLRPGEKLYEELLSDNTKNMPTHNDKIMISKDVCMEYAEINILINELSELFKTDVENKNLEAVKKIKKIVPEYISNNSIFEVLDKEISPKEEN